MPGHQHPGRSTLPRTSTQDGIHIHQARGFGDAGVRTRAGWLDEVIALHLQAVATGCRDRLELRFDPIGRGQNALPGRQVGAHAGKRIAGAEAHQFRDICLDVLGRDGSDGCCDPRVGRQRRRWCVRHRLSTGSDGTDQQEQGRDPRRPFRTSYAITAHSHSLSLWQETAIGLHASHVDEAQTPHRNWGSCHQAATVHRTSRHNPGWKWRRHHGSCLSRM